MAAKLTFTELRGLLGQHAGQRGLPTSCSVPNLVSAMNAFLGDTGFHWHDQVGGVMRKGFRRSLAQHVERLAREGRAPRYIANRRHALNTWHRFMRRVDHDSAVRAGAETPLQARLLDLLPHGSVAAAVRAVGMRRQTLDNWRNRGMPPHRDSLRYLTRLEVHLQLEPGTLTDLVEDKTTRKAVQATATIDADRRARHARTRDRYRINHRNAPPRIRKEWLALLEYKVGGGCPQTDNRLGAVSGLLANDSRLGSVLKDGDESKTWRVRPSDPKWLEDTRRWPYTTRDGLYVPTADQVWGQLGSFLGWCALAPDRGGRGIGMERLSLGLLTDQELVLGFLDWFVARGGNKIHGGIVNFVLSVSALIVPGTGFLLGRPDIGAFLGCPTADSWREHCLATHIWLDTKIKPKLLEAKRRDGKARDPKDPIKALLALPRPLDAIAHAVRRLEAERPLTGGLFEAGWARDLLMLTMLMSNPLRVENLAGLTHYPDNTGSLQRMPGGGWKIRLGKLAFKNFRHAARERDYDQPIDPAVWPFIERYIKAYRPIIGGPRPELVFVSLYDPDRLWTKQLSRRFRELMRYLMPQTGGFGPHSMRHLVATQIIKTTRGDYYAAAEALHDKPNTVRDEYFHLINEYSSSARRTALHSSLAIVAGTRLEENPPQLEPKSAAHDSH